MNDVSRVFITGQTGAVRTLADGGVRLTLELPAGSLAKLVALGLAEHGALCALCCIKPEREEKPEPPEPVAHDPPTEKGQYGTYSQALFRHGFFNAPPVIAALERESGMVAPTLGQYASEVVGARALAAWGKEQLRALFMVDSLTQLNPFALYDWAQANDLVRFLPNEYREIRAGLDQKGKVRG